MGKDTELELYLHIPFCARKCNYCDFLSAPASRKVQARYMEALFKEAEGRSGEAGNCRVCSVFIGGGTPSLLEKGAVRKLLEVVRKSYRLCADAEITIECNPGTLDREKLEEYRSCGINRLSLGLQSASGEELRFLGRIHTYGQFLQTYAMAREAGFSNVNVDVMSALPGQTAKTYEKTLLEVLQLIPPPEHISAYSLIVEEGTPFYRLKEQGRLPLPEEEEERLMYYRTGEILAKAGYRRYEISNYALPGRECRHNIGYWIRRPYLGLGLGAASLYNETRFSNTSDLEAYMRFPLEGRSGAEKLSVEEQMEETLFLGLRLMEGIRDRDFFARFGKHLEEVYGSVIAQSRKDGLLVYEDGRLCLTERGIDVSNSVFARFLF